MNLTFKMISNFKNNAFISFGFLLFVLSCSPRLTPTDDAAQIVIDGDDADWNRNYYRKAENSNLIYALAEDEKSFKVLIKAMDEKSVKKLVVLGLTIWVDGTGKNKKQVGIRYPLGLQHSPGFKEKMAAGGLKNMDREQLSGKGLQMLKDKKVDVIGLIGVLEDNQQMYQYDISALNIPIEIQRSVTSVEVVLEYAIPKSILKKGKKGMTSIGLEMESIDVQSMMAQRGGGRGGRFGGARGAGMAGRGRGINSAMRDKMEAFQELNQPVMIWSKVEME